MALQVVINGVTVTTDCESEMVNFLLLYKKSQETPELVEQLPDRAQLLEQLGALELSEPPVSPRARRNTSRRSRRAKQRQAARRAETSAAPVEAFVAHMGGYSKSNPRPKRSAEELQVAPGQVWQAVYGNSKRQVLVEQVVDDVVHLKVVVAGNKSGRSIVKPVRVSSFLKSYRLQ